MDTPQSGGDALEYLCDPRWKASRLGLDRTYALLDRMGNPESGLKFVHITGTNGKGSTAAMLASMLTESGLRVGLFTSPYLERMAEQIQIDRHPISDEAFEEAAARAKDQAEGMQDHPTEFEMLVCAALAYFAKQRCDLVVLEVGMGGLRDATNVIPAPEVAVLTTVALDHTDILGDTVEKIAAEKAGIIKTGCSVVLCAQTPSVEAVVRGVCEQNGCPLAVADPERMLQAPAMDERGLHFTYRGDRLALPLIGRHQLQNAAVALCAVECLRERGWEIPDEAVAGGLAKVVWPGRLERLGDDPFFLVDGAHNPQGAQTLANTLSELFPKEKFLFLVGVLADKDRKNIFTPLLPMAGRFVTVTPDNPRALPGDKLAEELSSAGFEAQSFGSVKAGVAGALALARPGERICAFGSLYQVGAIRATMRERQVKQK